MVWDAHRSVKTIDFSAALTEACVWHHYKRAVALPRSEASATLLPPPAFFSALMLPNRPVLLATVFDRV